MRPPRREFLVHFRRQSTGSRQAPPTAWTLMRAATARSSERVVSADSKPKPIVDRQFEIEFLDAGVETFAFTFG